MTHSLTTGYNWQLVLLSVAIAILASYTTLDLAGRVTANQGKQQWGWLVSGATAMGIGIWAMHFIGMLAFYLPVTVTYDFGKVLISILPAIAASGLALFLVSRPQLDWLSLIGGSLLMGGGIASMHYLGMMAMQIKASMIYSPKIVALSVMLAIIIAFAALSIVFRLRDDTKSQQMKPKILGAMVMGAAIPTMHYTGMAAVTFYAKGRINRHLELLPPENGELLAVSIAIATLIILGLALLTAFFDRKLSAQAIQAQIVVASQKYLKIVIQGIPIGVLVIEDDGSIRLYNQAILDLLNLSTEQQLQKLWHQAQNTNFETLNPENSDLITLKPIFQLLKQISSQRLVQNQVVDLVITEDSAPISLLINTIPLEKLDSQPQILCTFNNITSLKRAETKIKESEAKFKQLAQQEQILNNISAQIRQSLELNIILQTAVSQIRQCTEADRALIYQFDPNWLGKVILEDIAPSWSSVLNIAGDNCFPEICLQRYRDGNLKAINNVIEADLDPQHREFLQKLSIKSNLIIPIRVQTELWGLLILHQCSYSRAWQESESHLLERLAIQLGIAIQQATLYSQARINAQQAAIFNALSKQIRQSLDLNIILQTAVTAIRDFFKSDRVLVYHFNEDWSGYFLAESVASGWKEILREQDTNSVLTQNTIQDNQCYFTKFDLESPIQDTYLQDTQGGLFNQGVSYRYVDDIYSKNFSPCYIEYLEQLQARAYVIVPIFVATQLWGLLAIYQNNAPRQWQITDITMVVQISEQLGIAIQQSNLYAQSKQNALEAQQQAEQLQQTLKELGQTQSQLLQSEKMSSLGQLVAGVAHEINNPVNFIHGNLPHTQGYVEDLLNLIELYREHYPEPANEIQEELEAIEIDFLQEDIRKMINSMKTGTERIRQIVLSLRNFSRMDEAEFKAVDIHEGIDSTIMILQHRLKAKSERPEIKVIKNYGQLPLVECYAGQLNQVLMNIISNAIDALEETNFQRSYAEISQHPNQITISTSVNDCQGVTIAIADNGPGMSEDVQQRIFDPFFTTKAIGKGTGMGMSISYQIITEKHQGTIKCHSTLGQGTEFVIEIPIQHLQ